MNILNAFLTLSMEYIVENEKRNIRFKEKQQEAKKLYWDACKYPRKKKKAIRKQAIADYRFYGELCKV